MASEVAGMALSTPMRLEDVPYELQRSEEGGFVAFNDDLRIAALGATEDEAAKSFRHSVGELVALCVERKLPIPEQLQQLRAL